MIISENKIANSANDILRVILVIDAERQSIANPMEGGRCYCFHG